MNKVFVATGQAWTSADTSYTVVIGVYSTKEKAEAAVNKWHAVMPSWRTANDVESKIVDEEYSL